jgi:hypothetical protein
MGKIQKALLVIALYAASFVNFGCGTSYSYGAKSTLYLTGPHGEPAPVVISENAPQPRGMVFRVYKTENGEEALILEDRGEGKSEPRCYKIGYVKYNGEKGLALLPVKIGIYPKNPANGQPNLKETSGNLRVPNNTNFKGELERRLEGLVGKSEGLLNKSNEIANATSGALQSLKKVLNDTLEAITSVTKDPQNPESTNNRDYQK